MGDERKIGSSKEIVRYFLKHEIKSKTRSENIYNLEEEFEKTKSNKNYIIPVVFLIFLLIGIATYFVMDSISRRSYDVDIGQKELKDLSAEDMVNSYYDKLSYIQSYQRDIKNLEFLRNLEIEFQKDRLDKEVFLTLSRTDISEDSIAKVLKNISNNFASSLGRISNYYDSLIEERISNIQELRKAVQELKPQILALSPELLVSQRRIVDIEVSKERRYNQKNLRTLVSNYNRYLNYQNEYFSNLVDTLTMRYNPIFKDQRVISIIDNTKPTRYNYNNLYELPLLDSEISNYVNEIVERILNRKLIMDEISKIPFTNSLPSAIRSQEDIYEGILVLYESITRRYLDHFNATNSYLIKKLGTLNYFVMSYLRSLRNADGCVVDSRDKTNILVVLKEEFTNSSYSLSFFKQGAKEPFARGVGIYSDGFYVVSRITYLTNQTLLPMDIVMVSR
ncbi:MAG: hypothetical protein N3D81_05810 [Spirochaetes bacterium]|nr:hypothetical protein [Spirochaetota bacterium]